MGKRLQVRQVVVGDLAEVRKKVDGHNRLPRPGLIDLDDGVQFPQSVKGRAFGLPVVSPSAHTTRAEHQNAQERHSTHLRPFGHQLAVKVTLHALWCSTR